MIMLINGSRLMAKNGNQNDNKKTTIHKGL